MPDNPSRSTSCTTGCICGCGQQGCGCRETSTRPRRGVGPSCSLCSGPAQSQQVSTPAGVTVLVTFCPTCDRKRCKPCGRVEADPTAQRCTSCGVKYP
jgi:hypothetical protein